MVKCVICRKNSMSIDEHHLVPQAAGGVNQPTIKICSNCHSSVHRAALQAMSKKPKNIKYFTDEEMLRAKPVIELIIASFRKARENPDKTSLGLLSLKAPRNLIEVLHLLKYDSQYTNMNDFCIAILRNYAIKHM